MLWLRTVINFACMNRLRKNAGNGRSDIFHSHWSHNKAWTVIQQNVITFHFSWISVASPCTEREWLSCRQLYCRRKIWRLFKYMLSASSYWLLYCHLRFKSLSKWNLQHHHIDGLMGERHISIDNTLELRLSCSNPLISTACRHWIFSKRSKWQFSILTQFYRHWGHQRLSWWRPSMPPVMIKPSLWWLSVNINFIRALLQPFVLVDCAD